MFNAEKARKLAYKVNQNKLSIWEKLQFKIREKAFRGETSLEIEDEEYLLLTTTLQVFGYEVNYDKEKEIWIISWT